MSRIYPAAEWDRLLRNGCTLKEIGAGYGVTRNVVAGTIHRFRNPPPKPRTHFRCGCQISEDNTYTDPSSGRKRCLSCKRRQARDYESRNYVRRKATS